MASRSTALCHAARGLALLTFPIGLAQEGLFSGKPKSTTPSLQPASGLTLCLIGAVQIALSRLEDLRADNKRQKPS